ncbi:MAG TPA: hypothetical protein PLV85_03570 [Polyangiaceae bacterium]|nr:hypothetical protein [Polyangiaceae bacterium]
MSACLARDAADSEPGRKLAPIDEASFQPIHEPRMKLHLHQFGNHRLRCQFEDPETARALWNEFIPAVLFHVFDIKRLEPNTELPVLHGQGFVFQNKLLTAFGEKFDVVIVDSEGLKSLANRVTSDGSTN